MASSALVIFAIQSALKLGAEAREAYVDATRRRALVLPLPNYQAKSDLFDAVEYFMGPGRRHIPQSQVLEGLRSRLEESDSIDQLVKGLSEEQKAELVVLHSDFATLDLLEKGFEWGETIPGFLPEDMANVLKIRQWRKGNDPHPTVLRRFAGTLIQIGVDYFSHFPGALNRHSEHGKLLYVLLAALDRVAISEALSEENLGDFPARLLVAMLETVSEKGDFLSGDPKYQKLVQVTSGHLLKDVAGRIDQIRTVTGGAGQEDKEERIRAWAELVFRSILSSGGRFVASNPEAFLGLQEPAESEMAGHVGQAVLSFVLDQPPGRLDRALGREGLEVIIRASLSALAKHPELLRDPQNVGLKRLFSAIASTLSRHEAFLEAGILPEMTRLILEKTGENLPLFWPDWGRRPENHLLLKAAETVLGILTSVPPGARWKPGFRTEDLLRVVEATFEEFAENPGWLVDRAGRANSNLKVALEAMIRVLRRQEDRRLSTRDASHILRAGLKAAALRQEFLHKLPNGMPLVAAIIDTILGSIFRKKKDPAAWSLVRSRVITGAIRTALEVLAETGPNEQKVQALESLMKHQVEAINKGQPWSLQLFEEGLRTELGVS